MIQKIPIYLINMPQRTYLKNGKKVFLPYGFHIINDLAPLFQMSDDLKKNQISKQAKLRLQWMDYYRNHRENASLTSRRYGISRKTFYYWLKRYHPFNLKSLEDRSRSPINRRKPETSAVQEQRIISLRKQYPKYSKIKLAIIYERNYQEKISSWKIQRTIQKYHLYCLPNKTAKIQRKRLRAIKKKRITELKKERRNGFLICLDSIIIYWNGIKRYIFTCIDFYSKILDPLRAIKSNNL